MRLHQKQQEAQGMQPPKVQSKAGGKDSPSFGPGTFCKGFSRTHRQGQWIPRELVAVQKKVQKVPHKPSLKEALII